MIRFLADADLNDAIVGGCRRREPAIDFWSANDAGLESVSDPEVLALAAAAERVLVSHDFQTMPRHFADYLQAHGSSPGLILVPQHMPIGDVYRGTPADLGGDRCRGVARSVAGAAPAAWDALMVRPVLPSSRPKKHHAIVKGMKRSTHRAAALP